MNHEVLEFSTKHQKVEHEKALGRFRRMGNSHFDESDVSTHMSSIQLCASCAWGRGLSKTEACLGSVQNLSMCFLRDIGSREEQY